MSYTVIYALLGTTREVKGVDHMPFLGAVVQIPDGSDQYGEVISVEKEKKCS